MTIRTPQQLELEIGEVRRNAKQMTPEDLVQYVIKLYAVELDAANTRIAELTAELKKRDQPAK